MAVDQQMLELVCWVGYLAEVKSQPLYWYASSFLLGWTWILKIRGLLFKLGWFVLDQNCGVGVGWSTMVASLLALPHQEGLVEVPLELKLTGTRIVAIIVNRLVFWSFLRAHLALPQVDRVIVLPAVDK